MSEGKRERQFPRILIGAAGSGSGKTLVTCGLLEIFRRRGLRPLACKCGPDYIDPMFHRYVLGVPGRNLDSFFLPLQQVRETLFSAMEREQAGIAVLEGVMGYYDGIGGTSLAASSWEIGAITGTPSILLVNGRGMSLSAAALVNGFARFVEDSGIQGVLLNRVSGMYYERLAAAMERETGIPVLGYLPESEDYRIESRHLGLFMPGELDSLRERIGRLADQMEKTMDIGQMLELAGYEDAEKAKEAGMAQKTTAGRRPAVEAAGEEDPAPVWPQSVLAEADSAPVQPQSAAVNVDSVSVQPQSAAGVSAAAEPDSDRLRIGVARDEAFCFYYQENLELLEQMGARCIPFSPLRDRELPPELDGLLLGGGYPENYGSELAKNQTMRESVRRAAEGGLPFLAECGGFLYLHRFLEGSDGGKYPMAGVYPFDACRTGKLRRFGYVRLLSPEGLEVRGHEFHYWESQDPGADWTAQKPGTARQWPCIHDGGGQIGGFPHFYYASCPAFLAGWLERCRAYREKRELK